MNASVVSFTPVPVFKIADENELHEYTLDKLKGRLRQIDPELVEESRYLPDQENFSRFFTKLKFLISSFFASVTGEKDRLLNQYKSLKNRLDILLLNRAVEEEREPSSPNFEREVLSGIVSSSDLVEDDQSISTPTTNDSFVAEESSEGEGDENNLTLRDVLGGVLAVGDVLGGVVGASTKLGALAIVGTANVVSRLWESYFLQRDSEEPMPESTVFVAPREEIEKAHGIVASEEPDEVAVELLSSPIAQVSSQEENEDREEFVTLSSSEKSLDTDFSINELQLSDNQQVFFAIWTAILQSKGYDVNEETINLLKFFIAKILPPNIQQVKFSPESEDSFTLVLTKSISSEISKVEQNQDAKKAALGVTLSANKEIQGFFNDEGILCFTNNSMVASKNRISSSLIKLELCLYKEKPVLQFTGKVPLYGSKSIYFTQEQLEATFKYLEWPKE